MLLRYSIQIQESSNFPEQSKAVLFPKTDRKFHVNNFFAILSGMRHNYPPSSHVALESWDTEMKKGGKKIKKALWTQTMKLSLCKGLHQLLLYHLPIHAIDFKYIHVLELM